MSEPPAPPATAASGTSPTGVPRLLPIPVSTPASGAVPADPDRTLSAGTARLIAEGVPANTRRAYERVGRQWFAWCAAAGRTALPATPETLAEYVAHLAGLDRAPSTIEQAIAAIRTLHRLAGHPGAPDTGPARLVLRAHRRHRAAGGRRARQATPATVGILRALVDATDPHTLAGHRDRLLVVLGFALMGRRSELAALQLDDVTETDDGLLVLIRASKTDQDAIGEQVAVPCGAHPGTDPVRLLRAWRAALSERGVIAGSLLRSVDRHGNPGRSLSGDGVNDIVRRLALKADLPGAATFTAHSLRAGGATSAYKGGAPVSTIARHGRWAPNSPVVLGYIRAVDQWTDNPMRGAGL